MSRRSAIATVAGALVVATCQVYDPGDLIGPSVGSGAGSAGVASSGGGSVGGTGGSAEGGTSAPGGESGGGDPDAGAPGEGGAAGTGSGGTAIGGSSAGGGGPATGGSDAGGAGTSMGGGAGTAAGTDGSGGDSGSAGGGAGGAGGPGGSAGSAGSAGAGGSPVGELVGTATASSSENTSSQMHPPEHGNDNDPATRWCAANGNLNHYWTLDLGAEHALSRIEIAWEYPPQAVGASYGYTVSVSSDGTGYTVAIDLTANSSTDDVQIADFPPGILGRYVRITVTALPPPDAMNRPTWASFWEARVFGI